MRTSCAAGKLVVARVGQMLITGVLENRYIRAIIWIRVDNPLCTRARPCYSSGAATSNAAAGGKAYENQNSVPCNLVSFFCGIDGLLGERPGRDGAAEPRRRRG